MGPAQDHASVSQIQPLADGMVVFPCRILGTGNLCRSVERVGTSTLLPAPPHLSLPEHGRRKFPDHLQGESEVRLKKYLYVLRPLVCIRWVEQQMGPPPTSIWATLEGVELPVAVRSSLVELLHRKMEADELGTGSPNPSLHDFIQSELDRIPEAITHLPHRNPPEPSLDELVWTELGI